MLFLIFVFVCLFVFLSVSNLLHCVRLDGKLNVNRESIIISSQHSKQGSGVVSRAEKRRQMKLFPISAETRIFVLVVVLFLFFFHTLVTYIMWFSFS